jgi:hypothetical protein
MAVCSLTLYLRMPLWGYIAVIAMMGMGFISHYHNPDATCGWIATLDAIPVPENANGAVSYASFLDMLDVLCDIEVTKRFSTNMQAPALNRHSGRVLSHVGAHHQGRWCRGTEGVRE